MVAIVDDTPEVWGERGNLIPAFPYKFFPALDEVNALPGQRSRRASERAVLRARYALLPLISAMHVDDDLLSALEDTSADVKEKAQRYARAVAYHLLVALRVLYEWKAEEAESEVLVIANAWQLGDAQRTAIKAWVENNLQRAESQSSDTQRQLSSTAAIAQAKASAAKQRGDVAVGTQSATDAGSDATAAAAATLDSDGNTDNSDKGKALDAEGEAAETADMAAATAAVATSGGREQALQELPFAADLIDTALEGMTLSTEKRGDELWLRASADEETSTTAQQRRLIFSYVLCLRKQQHEATSTEGSLGAWLGKLCASRAEN